MTQRLQEGILFATGDRAALCFHMWAAVLIASLFLLFLTPIAGLLGIVAAFGFSFLAVRLSRGSRVQPEAF
ncbi:MAG: hypothetical protein CMK09_09475 [Ponticaulis sp.]|nr:hypothetical protein [Ponticaulis sp.]|tara:strand:+ start:62204 stop:62416 length:213 start_codon:yes stop_codon:yes gene_type:complete